MNKTGYNNIWHVILGFKRIPFVSRLITSAIALLIYLLLFEPLYGSFLNFTVVAFSIFPIFIVSNMFGILGGVVIGLLIVPINWLMLQLGESLTNQVASFLAGDFWIAHGFFLILGLLFGYMHDMHLRLRKELVERRKVEKELEHLATHDPLTGVPNRLMFYECAKTAITRALRRGEGLGILFLDLDGYKRVNDRFGHAYGDKVLIEVGKRIKEALRESDCVGRIGGDEFAIALESVWEEETIAYICKRLLQSISNPISIEGHEVTLTASIGVSKYPHNGDNIEQLLKFADLAMYSMKSQGKNSYCFYGKTDEAVILEPEQLQQS